MRAARGAVLTRCFISVPLFANVFMWPIYLENAGIDHLTRYWLMVFPLP